MAKVRTEHKDKLLAMGKWPEFVLYRDEMKANGVKSIEANRLAVLKFLGVEAAENAGERRVPHPTKKPVVVFAVEKPREVLPAVVSPAPREEDGVEPPLSAEIPLSEFGGREASGSEIVLWVIRHLDVADVKLEQCPDPAAWTYLKTCRDSAMFRQNFMLQVGLKSLLRIEGDDGAGDISGERLDETIAKLLSFRGDLRGSSSEERRAHAPEAVGSTPAPAITVSV